MKILKKLFPIIGLIYFGLTCYGQTRGVSYDPATTNVIQTVNQRFHALTNLAGTASTIAGYDANKKLGTISATATRTILEVPIFDSTDPGAANIFPFWDDAQNEVDWTSSGALRTLLGLDTNDDVTFGTVTATTVTATTLAGAGGGITYNGAGNNGNLGTGVNTLQELNDAVDNLNIGEGGGSAPEGTMVNSGASTQYSFTYYTDTTGTNMAASLISTDSTLTNLLAGGVKANVLVLTNISESLSNIGLGTEDSPQFTAIELNHASANTLSASGGVLSIEGAALAKTASPSFTGSPSITLGNGATGPGAARYLEDTDNGANYVSVQAPSALGGDRTMTLADGNTVIPIIAQALTISGPTAARTITVPDANFTVARTDAANTFTGVQTMTSPAITTANLSGAQLLAEGASLQLDAAGSADGAFSGVTRTGTAGATLAFGDLIVLDATDSRWELADANSASGADGDSRGIIGICVQAAAADGSATTILLSGIVRADAAFPALTINGPIYISETAGDITQTSPTTEDNVVRILGAAWTADEIHFAPDRVWTVYDAP